jgi:TatD DNase family protein
MIDSHCHLTYAELSTQVEAVLCRARDAGVTHIITIGTDIEDAKKAVEVSHRYPGLVSMAAGFHPHHADKVEDGHWSELSGIWDDPKVVAFGEMGLDYHYDFADRDNQRRVFSRQLDVARERGKPIIIHAREAFEDVAAILLDHGFRDRRVVFHCFTGTAAEAARIAEHGWRLSFTGVITFPKSTELHEIAKAYPADKLMIETDAPYLSPVPVRSKRPNEPAFVAHTARFLASLRGVSLEALAAQTQRNTAEFFRLQERAEV